MPAAYKYVGVTDLRIFLHITVVGTGEKGGGGGGGRDSALRIDFLSLSNYCANPK